MWFRRIRFVMSFASDLVIVSTAPFVPTEIAAAAGVSVITTELILTMLRQWLGTVRVKPSSPAAGPIRWYRSVD